MKKNIRNSIIIVCAALFIIISSGFNFYIHQCSHKNQFSSSLLKSGIECQVQNESHSCCHHHHEEESEQTVSYHCCSDYHKYIAIADYFVPSKAFFLSFFFSNHFNNYYFDYFLNTEFQKKAFHLNISPPNINTSLTTFFAQFRI